MTAGQLGSNDFAADRGRSLLAAPVPCPVRAIDVMEARHACKQTEVLRKVAAHSLAEQLFPTVSVFRHGRIGIRFFQSGILWVLLLVSIVNTSRRRIKIAPHTTLFRNL